MREQQFIRFVQEISFLLKLSQPCSKTALQYFLQFKQYEGHQFDQQIMIASCIYLSTKIFEQQVRVRDILNMIYVLTRVYKLAKIQQQQKQQQVRMKNLKQQRQEILVEQENQGQKNGELQQIVDKNDSFLGEQENYKQKDIIVIKIDNDKTNKVQKLQKQQQHSHPHPQIDYHHQQQIHLQQFILLNKLNHYNHNFYHFYQQIQPQYSLSDYNQYKSKIIQAQQTLLRILGFDFILAQKNKTQLKQLLLTMHYLHVPATLAQTIIKVYNDVHYVDVQLWLEGVVYFGYLLVKNMVETKEQQLLSDNKNHQDQRLQQQKPKHDKNKTTKQPSQKQINQTKRIKQFINKMSLPQLWEFTLCTSIKQLQNYAEKLANFYLSIDVN